MGAFSRYAFSPPFFLLGGSTACDIKFHLAWKSKEDPAKHGVSFQNVVYKMCHVPHHLQIHLDTKKAAKSFLKLNRYIVILISGSSNRSSLSSSA